MLKIPAQTLLPYDELLVKRAVPELSHFSYKKWLRYYLDFCHKFRFELSKSGNFSGFLNKLKDKKQNEGSTKASRSCNINHSGTIYEIRKPNFNKKGNNKARTINRRLPSPNTIEKLLTKGDWTPAYNDLDSVIKSRGINRWVVENCRSQS